MCLTDQFLLVVATYKSGIQCIDGKYLTENGTAVTGHQLPLHKVVQLDLAVRNDSIAMWVKSPDERESRRIVSYTGRQDRLSLEKDWVKGIKNTKACSCTRTRQRSRSHRSYSSQLVATPARSLGDRRFPSIATW